MQIHRSRQMVSSLLVAFACLAGAREAIAQAVTLTGKVQSEQGQPLFGANVVISELNISTGTNEQGIYRVVVPAERQRGQTVQMRVRSIGYTPMVKAIVLQAGTVTTNFDLKVDINKLQEVVITGTTGATETKKLGFTVSRVEVADIPVPSTNALSTLAGKVTGATVVMPSGRPGTGAQIVLRGPKSIDASGRDQQPLLIVDGVVTNGSLQDLNTQDIESIEVVKGAAASSTYGSRAGNGVISITTKSGKNSQGGVRFNARSEYGFSDIETEYPFSQRHLITMNEDNTRFCIIQTGRPACSRSVDFQEEALRVNEQGKTFALAPYNFERDGGIAVSLSKPLLKGTFQVNQWPVRYNPIAQTVTNGLFNNTNLDMNGKFGNTGFFASVSNLLEQGSIRYLDGFSRNTGRLNLDQTVGEDLNIGLQTFYSRGTQYPDGEFFRLTRVPAGVNLLRKDNQGRLFIRSNPLNQGQQNENPLYDNQQIDGRTDADRYLGGLTARYNPLSWLDFDANASIDRRRNSGYQLIDRGFRQTASAQGTRSLGSLFYGSTLQQSYNMSFGATARQHDPLGIKDLDVRWNARYAFEQQDAEATNNTGNPNAAFLNTGGTSLAVPGLLTLGNVTVLSSPASATQSVRALGALVGTAIEFKGKYIMDFVFREDGSSLFGSDQRYHPYYRASLAYRLSDEGWWPFKTAVNEFKWRSAIGTAGGRPSFVAQYETFTLGAGGTVSGTALGNRDLKPENTTETEFGFDAELWNKYGLSVTFARDITKDQILRVPPPAASGFSTQWKNAGTLDNKTWEASLNFPILNNRNVVWTSRVSYDRNRAIITGLGVPPYFQTTESNTFHFAPGERIGTIWGKFFIRDCSQLSAQFATQCGTAGSGAQFQPNDEGFIVWTGGRSPSEGVTNNAWQAVLPGCLKAGAQVVVTGEVACHGVGGTVNNPWGIPNVHWGMPMVIRDSLGNPVLQKLGNTQPDFHMAWTQNFSFKKFSVYTLVDGNYGQRLFNEEIHWSQGDFMVRYEDQDGKTVQSAKPAGYYWRATQPESGAGVGGFYDVLGSNNKTTQKATFTKLREVSVSYAIGRIRGVGDWNVSLVGRNLWTITDFLGWDPETGGVDPTLNSGAVGGVASFQYPQTRKFTVGIGTRF